MGFIFQEQNFFGISNAYIGVKVKKQVKAQHGRPAVDLSVRNPLGTELLQHFGVCSGLPVCFCGIPLFFSSQHPKAFGVSDGLEEPLFQLFLGGVFREQQGVKAGVRGR